MIWVGRLIIDWLIITILFIAAYHVHWMWWWIIAIIVGSRQHALAEIGHMTSHRLGFRNKYDDWIARVAFYPLTIDIKKYRIFHLMHHRNLGIEHKDPEVELQKRFSHRWKTHRTIDSVYDSLGLTIDESLAILEKLATVKSITIYTILLTISFVIFGWVVIIWPLALVTGLPLVQRLRARTEHQHLVNPGTTIYKTKPPLWARLTYLPHGVWAHYEHHNLKL